MSEYKIVENSWICRIGRVFMKANGLAMVIGKKIHLSGVKKEEFLKDIKWLEHELVHIDQYKRYGKLKFLWLYLLESIRHGYYNNKFEKEAREKVEGFDSKIPKP